MTRAVASAPKLPPSSASSLGRVRGRCHLQTRRASLPPHSPPPRPLFPTTHHLNVSDPLWRVQRPPATPSLADDVLKSISGGQDSWQDHRPPDERTLRLGKSKSKYRCRRTEVKFPGLTDMINSITDSLTHPPTHLHSISASLDRLAGNFSSFIPLHSPPSPCRQRPSSIPGSFVDRTSSMGLCTNCWQCGVRDSFGADCSHWTRGATSV